MIWRYKSQTFFVIFAMFFNNNGMPYTFIKYIHPSGLKLISEDQWLHVYVTLNGHITIGLFHIYPLE